MNEKKLNIRNVFEDSEISIVSSWPLQFTQAIPYIHELNKRGIKLHFFVSKHIMQHFPEVIATGVKVIELESLIKNNRIAYFTHSILKKVLLNVFRALFAWLWISRHPEVFVNPILSRVGWFLFKNPFPTRKIFHVTKARVPYLFCARGVKVYTLVGSWDHHWKIDAAGHKSDCVFVWNNDLAEDWTNNQGDKNVFFCFPLPFRYLINEKPPQILRTLDSLKPLTVLYPMTSASENSHGWFEEECKVVEDLAIACQKSKIMLLVKPKPYEKQEALNFLASFDNVEIGAYNTNSSKEELILTEEYNNVRRAELSKCDIVFNIGTTFVLEAALYGLPIVQLKICDCSILTKLCELQRTQHIRKYLLSQKSHVFEIDESSCLANQFLKIFTNVDVLKDKSNAFSKDLANWIYPNSAFESSIEDVVSTILK